MRKTKSALSRAVAAAAGASALLMAGAAQATLEDRDLDGDTVVDAFYDTNLDITWLRNAGVNGLMDWDTAIAWAAGFSFGGYDDWRLPRSGACFRFNCTTRSEMAHLWYVELGNPAGGPMTNTGNFQNLQSSNYWFGREFAPYPGYAWYFYTGYGSQGVNYKGYAFHAVAVRPGDVDVAVVVPEPGTYALMLAGLAGLAARARKRAS